MFTFIVIGKPGSGKSEWVKELIRTRRSFVFDVQNEYGQRTKYKGQQPLGFSDNPNAERARYVPKSARLREDVEKFMEMCRHKRDTNVVFEEATIFFEGRTGELTKTLIINRIHTGNVYYFVFHSIASVPPRIMQMASFVVLFATLDEDTQVGQKYSRLFVPYKELQESAGKEKFRIVKLM
jgi:hypothetical protein